MVTIEVIRSTRKPSNFLKAKVLLAQVWDGAMNPDGWWLSEKLDGVRAYWDGSRFLSREGNPFMAPAWFTEGLPALPLDGELFMARKSFQTTVGIVRRHDEADAWKSLKYLVFDAPAKAGAFEDRMAFLDALPVSDHAAIHRHVQCVGAAHVREELARVEAMGGEGLMLRQPGSAYVCGRSGTLLKVKSFRDAEAVVIDHFRGMGRHKGRLGALQVRTAAGIEFAVGSGFSDDERDHPPAIGSVITFRYQDVTDGGTPRFATFVGVRKCL